MLVEMVQSSGFEGAFAAAQAEYFGTALRDASQEQIREALGNEQTQIAFITGLLFDAYITRDRHRLMESVLHGDLRRNFSVGQLRYLERMAASAMRPYEVRKVRVDEGFTLRDLWSGDELAVRERKATHSLDAGDTFFARVIEGPHGAMEMHGAVLELRPLEMEELLQSLRASFRARRRAHPELDETTFLKEAGPRAGQAWLARFLWTMPALRTSDGQELRVQDLFFDVVDRDALHAALLDCGEFDHDEDGGQYVWLGGAPAARGGGSVILGELTLEGKRLRAFVMSDERAERLRALLERVAGGSLRYRVSEIHSLPSGQRLQRRDRPAEVKHVSEEEAKALDELFHRHYATWLDEKIPVLGGRTPRHAARLKTQRARVVALLRETESLWRRQHGRAPETTWIWEELGLTELR